MVTESARQNLSQGTSGNRVLSSTETSDWKRYRTRVMSKANKVNLEFEEAAPDLVAGLTRSISGHVLNPRSRSPMAEQRPLGTGRAVTGAQASVRPSRPPHRLRRAADDAALVLSAPVMIRDSAPTASARDRRPAAAARDKASAAPRTPARMAAPR